MRSNHILYYLSKSINGTMLYFTVRSKSLIFKVYLSKSTNVLALISTEGAESKITHYAVFKFSKMYPNLWKIVDLQAHNVLDRLFSHNHNHNLHKVEEVHVGSCGFCDCNKD